MSLRTLSRQFDKKESIGESKRSKHTFVLLFRLWVANRNASRFIRGSKFPCMDRAKLRQTAGGRESPGLTPPKASRLFTVHMFLNIWPYRPIPRMRRVVTQGRVTFRSHTWAMSEATTEAPVPSGSTPARREDGNPPLASETRYRNKRDRPPPKQTHIPLRGSALEFLTGAWRGAYAVALLSASLALGSHSNYVDFRQPCAREQTLSSHR